MAERRQKLSAYHRKCERRAASRVRYFLHARNYVEALREIGYALQHRTAGDSAESHETSEKIKKAYAKAKVKP